VHLERNEKSLYTGHYKIYTVNFYITALSRSVLTCKFYYEQQKKPVVKFFYIFKFFYMRLSSSKHMRHSPWYEICLVKDGTKNR